MSATRCGVAETSFLNQACETRFITGEARGAKNLSAMGFHFIQRLGGVICHIFEEGLTGSHKGRYPSLLPLY